MWEFNNHSPIYLQIQNQLILKIITGIFKPGDRLPSVRDLAVETKTNPNTIQKALQELETIALISTQRTNGKFVTEDLKIIQRFQRKITEEKIYKFMNEMKALNVDLPTVITLLKEKAGEER